MVFMKLLGKHDDPPKVNKPRKRKITKYSRRRTKRATTDIGNDCALNGAIKKYESTDVASKKTRKLAMLDCNSAVKVCILVSTLYIEKGLDGGQ